MPGRVKVPGPGLTGHASRPTGVAASLACGARTTGNDNEGYTCQPTVTHEGSALEKRTYEFTADLDIERRSPYESQYEYGGRIV